jgi:hypothetical protein
LETAEGAKPIASTTTKTISTAANKNRILNGIGWQKRELSSVNAD